MSSRSRRNTGRPCCRMNSPNFRWYLLSRLVNHYSRTLSKRCASTRPRVLGLQTGLGRKPADQVEAARTASKHFESCRLSLAASAEVDTQTLLFQILARLFKIRKKQYGTPSIRFLTGSSKLAPRFLWCTVASISSRTQFDSAKPILFQFPPSIKFPTRLNSKLADVPKFTGDSAQKSATLLVHI